MSTWQPIPGWNPNANEYDPDSSSSASGQSGQSGQSYQVGATVGAGDIASMTAALVSGQDPVKVGTDFAVDTAMKEGVNYGVSEGGDMLWNADS